MEPVQGCVDAHQGQGSALCIHGDTKWDLDDGWGAGGHRHPPLPTLSPFSPFAFYHKVKGPRIGTHHSIPAHKCPVDKRRACPGFESRTSPSQSKLWVPRRTITSSASLPSMEASGLAPGAVGPGALHSSGCARPEAGTQRALTCQGYHSDRRAANRDRVSQTREGVPGGKHYQAGVRKAGTEGGGPPAFGWGEQKAPEIGPCHWGQVSL